METWAKWPMTKAGVRHYGGTIFGRIQRVEDRASFRLLFFSKNAPGVYVKSAPVLWWVCYGRYRFERSTIQERHNWHLVAKDRMPRKLKKRIIGTRSRRAK